MEKEEVKDPRHLKQLWAIPKKTHDITHPWDGMVSNDAQWKLVITWYDVVWWDMTCMDLMKKVRCGHTGSHWVIPWDWCSMLGHNSVWHYIIFFVSSHLCISGNILLCHCASCAICSYMMWSYMTLWSHIHSYMVIFSGTHAVQKYSKMTIYYILIRRHI